MYAAKARWSPDGTQLAFIGIIRGQFWQVFVVLSGG
jgi:Tol biopolymer transport system component